MIIQGLVTFQITEQKSNTISNANDGQSFPCLALDDWWKNLNKSQKVTLIKVDVEGADLNVLNSAKEIIIEDKPVIFVEANKEALSRYGYSEKDLEIFLNDYGYHLFRNIKAKNSGKYEQKEGEYLIGRLSNLTSGFTSYEGHYNVLAVHPQSDRYPKSYKGCFYTQWYLKLKQVKRTIPSKMK